MCLKTKVQRQSVLFIQGTHLFFTGKSGHGNSISRPTCPHPSDSFLKSNDIFAGSPAPARSLGSDAESSHRHSTPLQLGDWKLLGDKGQREVVSTHTIHLLPGH